MFTFEIMRRDSFQAIADPVRREILEILSTDMLSVNEIADHFDISRQAVSKQLKILSECGLVTVSQSGRERFYKVEPDGLIPAFMWIDRLQRQWEERLDSFEAYVQKLKADKDGNGR